MAVDLDRAHVVWNEEVALDALGLPRLHLMLAGLQLVRDVRQQRPPHLALAHRQRALARVEVLQHLCGLRKNLLKTYNYRAHAKQHLSAVLDDQARVDEVVTRAEST